MADSFTEYQIVRTNRKTIAILLRKDGRIEVRMPLHAPDELASCFVQKKQKWIRSKQHQIQKTLTQQKAFWIGTGNKLWFLGKQYPIFEADIQKTTFCNENFFVPEAFSQAERKQSLITFYQKAAYNILEERTHNFAQHMNASIRNIKIHNAHAQWGSCSGKNDIYYAWKLVLAPFKLIDYVIVHELSHTFYHNHSPAFWHRVEEYLLDYQIRKKELRAFGQLLQSEPWSKPSKP